MSAIERGPGARDGGRNVEPGDTMSGVDVRGRSRQSLTGSVSSD